MCIFTSSPLYPLDIVVGIILKVVSRLVKCIHATPLRLRRKPRALKGPSAMRHATLILPTHDPDQTRRLVAILSSEGESTDYASCGECVKRIRHTISQGYVARSEAEALASVFSDGHLHISIRPDELRYSRSTHKYHIVAIRVSISPYSTDGTSMPIMHRIFDLLTQ